MRTSPLAVECRAEEAITILLTQASKVEGHPAVVFFRPSPWQLEKQSGVDLLTCCNLLASGAARANGDQKR